MNLIEKNAKTILLGLILIFLFSFYHEVILSPNSYLFGASGDGIKNYFTVIDQIKETSFTQSTAMNYPYGEHFLYLDCHPALSIIFKILSKIFPFIGDYSLAFVNLLMIASIGLTAWFLNLIFLHYKIRPLVAMVAGFSIAILAPQLFRMTGHYALSYSFFFPLTWYLFIRFRESNNKWKWSILIGLSTLFWFFTHAYLGMIVFAFFMVCYLFEGLLSFKEKVLDKTFWAHIFIQLIIPFLFIFLYSRLSDTHIGRTTNPYGFMEVATNFDSVFLPTHEPLAPYFQNLELNQIWEGWSYVGMGTNIGLCFIALVCIYWLIRYKRFPFKDLDISVPLIITFLASICILMIAFGFPFKWHPGLLNRFAMVKNFRGIGRFAWAFYYASTIFVIVFISRFFELKKQTITAAIPVLFISLSFMWEGIPYHKTISKDLTVTPNYFNEKLLNSDWKKALQSIDFSKYQAIIPLPYFHIGSENFGKESTDEMYIKSMVLGYYTNLPLMANHSGRTSIWEAKNNLQIISPVFYDKAIEKDIKDNRPFLIIYTNDDLLEFEYDLLSRSVEIFKSKTFSLFEISKESLFSKDASKWINAFEAKENQLLQKGDFLIEPKDSLSYVYFNSFEDQPSEFHRSGKGGLATYKQNYTLLKKFEPGELEEGREYILSFWLYNNGLNYGQDIPNGLIFHQVEKEQAEWVQTANVSAGLIIDGNWSLVEMKFKGYKDFESSIVVKGDDMSLIVWQMDDLLIRPADVTIYQKKKDFLWMNNHRIKW